MYPGHWAQVTPDKPAVVMAGTDEAGMPSPIGSSTSARPRLARVWQNAGLRPGDGVALFMENQPRFLEVVWAALRSGLRVTPVNRYLTAAEAAYIVNDCDARALVTSTAMAPGGRRARSTMIPGCKLRLSVDGSVDGYDSYEDALAAVSGRPARRRAARPAHALQLGDDGPAEGDRPAPVAPLGRRGRRSPHRGRGAVRHQRRQRLPLPRPDLPRRAARLLRGAPPASAATVVLMAHFDPLEALAAVERHRCTHSQWVPTMFSRMLKLPEADRTRFDLSAHTVAIHAAAPCPRPVKEAMFEWWGPIIHEYYGGSELNGLTYVGAAGLAGPSRHRRPGRPRECCTSATRRATSCPPGEPGLVYFEQEIRRVPLPQGRGADPVLPSIPSHPNWTALGDVGYVDEDGLPVPHRPGDVHDHLRRREHLSPGDRGRPRHAPAWSTTSPSSACPTPTWAKR